MTVATTTNITTYTGNGATTAFATGFPFLGNADLQVTRITIADGTRTLLVEGTNYTVAGAMVSSGGTVTTIGSGSPLSGAYQLEILRATQAIQPTDYVANDALPAETHEAGLDRLTMLIQELQERVADIIAGGVGAITMSNRPVSGAGFYSQQVANDFQFKKLYCPVGFTTTEDSDKVRLDVGPVLDPTASAFSRPLTIDNAQSFALSWKAAGTGVADHRAVTTLLIADNLTNDEASLKFIGADDTGTAAYEIICEMTQWHDANQSTVLRASLFGHTSIYDQGNVSGSVTIDMNRGGRQKCTLTGNITSLTVTAPFENRPAHGHFDFKQDGTGSRTIAWPSSFKWATNKTATDKLLSTAANARDRLVWDFDGTDYLVDLIKGRA